MKKNKDRLDSLLKTDGTSKDEIRTFLENSKKYKNTKQQMRGICQALNIQSNKYKPEITIKAISGYIKKTDKLDRILYSEISNYIFGLRQEDRGTFSTNIEYLLIYVLDDTNIVQDDVRKIVIKVYDHVQLAIHQVENASNIFQNSVLDAKNKLHDEIKGIEREHITILGIFASIVVAFVSGITFTTSVLQNIDKVSIFRLILTVDITGAVLINVIYLLISFILRINDIEKESNKKFIKNANWIFLGISVIVIVGWLLNILDLQAYISRFLVWTKK